MALSTTTSTAACGWTIPHTLQDGTKKMPQFFASSYFTFSSQDLSPPWLRIRAEISLNPRRKRHNVIFHIDMCQSEGEGRWPTHNLAFVGILTAVAGANELVFGRYPWDNAAEVRAYSVQAKGFEGCRCFGDNEVRRIALHTHTRACLHTG